MSFVSAYKEDEVRAPFVPGRTSIGTHITQSWAATIYDLPLQNIQRGVELATAPYEGVFNDVLSPEEANAKYGIQGQVAFDKPIVENKARLINQFKQEELERMQLLELGNDTLFRKAANLTTGFVAQAGDPINLAAMFIPIVSEHRFATLVAKHGLTKARILAGGLEAGVGMAMVEPMSYLSKSVGEQNMYNWRNTIANASMGTALGVGLRLGGGKLRDAFFGKYTPDDILNRAESLKKKGSMTTEEMYEYKRNLSQKEVPLARQQQLLDDIIINAKRSADESGLEVGTEEYNQHILNQVKFGEKMHMAEIHMLQKDIGELAPSYHRRAFEETMNNLLNDEPMFGASLSLVTDLNKDILVAMRRSAETINEAEVKTTTKAEADAAKPKAKKVQPETKESPVIDDPGTLVHKYQGAEIEVTDTPDSVRVHVVEYGDEDARIALVYREIERAFKEGKEFAITNERGEGAFWGKDMMQEYLGENQDNIMRKQLKKEQPDYKKPKDPFKEKDGEITSLDPELKHDADVETAAKLNEQNEELIVDQAATDVRAAFEESLEGLPPDIASELRDLFDAPDRLDDLQRGIDDGIDCFLGGLL